MKKKITTKPMRFSYSKMSTYKQCPLSYKFKYIDKIPGTQKFFFAFGSAIHAALEFMHKNLPAVTVEQVIKSFITPWAAGNYRAAGYSYKDRYDADMLKGVEMLRAYYQKYKERGCFVVEYATTVEVDGLAVKVIADKIEVVRDSVWPKGVLALRIVDYKTGKAVKRTPEQLMMYQFIIEQDPKLLSIAQITYGKQIKKLKVVDTVYLHVPTLEEHVFPRSKPKELKSFWDDVKQTAQSICAEKFDAKYEERNCSWCDHKCRCDAFKAANKSTWSPNL